jgi:hypothetical protein
VADIFFSYSRRDRERVGLVRNALAEMGFEVFWDQETPSGSDWDTWIRGELAKSKCAVVFWSATSIVSDNVRHEAVVAKEQMKLISVFLDQLPARDLPMGFYSQQAADLSKWDGDQEDAEWRKFRGEFEAKLMPRWVQQKLNRVDAELEGERARRETAEAHEKTLRAQISKEAKVQQELNGERDRALIELGEFRTATEERDKALQAQIAKQVETEQVLKSRCESALAEAAKFKTALHERDATLQEQTAKQADTQQGLKTERDRAFAEVAKLTAPDGPGNPTKRWLSPIAVGIVLLAAVAGAFVLLSPGRKADGEAEAKFAELTATVTKSDKARQDAEAKATQTAAALAKSEQARQAAEAKAADAEKVRQAAAARADDADKARQTAEAKASDADKARQAVLAKANDADKARLAAEAKAAGTVTSGPASPSSQFTRRSNMEAKSNTAPLAWALVASIDVCEKNCTLTAGCNAFAYNKQSTLCFTYKNVDLVPNENYDSGVLATVTSGQFSQRSNMEARGYLQYAVAVASTVDCEQRCALSNACKVFSYNKKIGRCYSFSEADLYPNDDYDSGIRN